VKFSQNKYKKTLIHDQYRPKNVLFYVWLKKKVKINNDDVNEFLGA